jgi:hypothetical protein
VVCVWDVFGQFIEFGGADGANCGCGRGGVGGGRCVGAMAGWCFQSGEAGGEGDMEEGPRWEREKGVVRGEE